MHATSLDYCTLFVLCWAIGEMEEQVKNPCIKQAENSSNTSSKWWERIVTAVKSRLHTPFTRTVVCYKPRADLSHHVTVTPQENTNAGSPSSHLVGCIDASKEHVRKCILSLHI